MVCPARLISDSTDQSSESADMEVLSDSSDTDNDESPLTITHSHMSSSEVKRSSSAQSFGSIKNPWKMSEGSDTSQKRKRHRGRRGGRGKKKAINRDKPSTDMFSMAVGALNEEGLTFEQTGFFIEESESESESDSDIEMHNDSGSPEVNRLMSLNSMDMYDSDEGEEEKGVATPMSAKAVKRRQDSNPSGQGGRLEPVGVFWDIENCQVPPGKSAFALAGKIRREFFRGKREAEFLCVCDITKEKKEVIDALNKAQVSITM